MTASPPYVLVPREPTEPMWGELARQIVFWNRFQHPTGKALYEHLTHCYHEAIPEWLRAEIADADHVPPKGSVAVAIYKAMLSARPESSSKLQQAQEEVIASAREFDGAAGFEARIAAARRISSALASLSAAEGGKTP